MLLLCAICICCYCLDFSFGIGKTGVPGIKIKTASSVDDLTEYPEFNSVVGSEVALPCNLSPPSQDDGISLVLWYRLDLNNPLYTLDARTTAPDKAKHYSGKVLGNRAHFNLSLHRPSLAFLRIFPVQENDAGDYRCRIDFRRGRTLSRMVKLNVIVPVKRVIIKGKDNITYSGLIGPFTEGTPLVLICEAQGGNPSPIVRWRQGANPVPGSISEDERGYVRNEIVFLRLQREDLMTVLTCQASNNNFSSPVYSSVTIDLNLKPLGVQITTAQRTLSAGEVMEVSCQSQGSRPSARISWMKGLERVDHQAIENVFGDITASTLTFVVSAEDHNKNLVCKAQNPDLPESALEDNWKLVVHYQPQLSLAYGTSQQTEHLREGGDVYFECNIQANPPVTEVKWRFQNRNLVHDPLRGVVIRNHSLLLHDVGKRNRGTYQCLAINTQGTGKSEEAYLRVQHSPVCSSHQRSVYGVARNEEAEISCQVDADPQEVSFRWSFNNSLGENIEIISYSSEGSTKSVATYTPRTKFDYGAMMCFAKNSVGTMREPCVFAIVPTGPPEPLHNCTITNQTFSSLILACEAGDDGGTSQTFHLEVYGMKREQLLANVSSAQNPVFIVQNLPNGASFILVVYSSNSKGRSTTVALTASTLFSPERQTNGDTRNVISAVLLVSLAALGTLALLTVAAVVAVIKSRTRPTANTGQTVEHEMIEKFPKSTSKGFEDGNPYVYHTRNAPTEYVHLTPKSASESIYESLIDGKPPPPQAFQTALCKVHSLKEEGLEVIMPVIER